MNTHGRIFRVSIFGESHGPGLGVLIDGVPPGIPLSPNDFAEDLSRRHPGGPGTTQRKEQDKPILRSGLFNGHSTGAPLMIEFENADVDSSAYEKNRSLPRPGHADWAVRFKYSGYNDYRGGGHTSGRLTLGLVAAGVVAKTIIHPMIVKAFIIEIGGTQEYEGAIRSAIEAGDSIGGIVECSVRGVPPGLGEPFFDSLESTISHAIFSIPAIKGLEFGAGFACARMRGSQMNDPILDPEGRTASNNSGGINGGISNGNEIVFRVAVRPASSISAAQENVNMETGMREKLEVRGRHDAALALRVPPVLEATTAVALADALLIHQTQNPPRT